MSLKEGDYFKLPAELKEGAKTSFNYAQVENVPNGENRIEATLVDDEEVEGRKVLNPIMNGITFSFSQYDLIY